MSAQGSVAPDAPCDAGLLDAAFTPGILCRLRMDAERNAHGESLLHVAQTLGLPSLSEEVARINRKQCRLGCLPLDLHHERFALYERVMEKAKACLSESVYRAVHRCM